MSLCKSRQLVLPASIPNSMAIPIDSGPGNVTLSEMAHSEHVVPVDVQVVHVPAEILDPRSPKVLR